MYRTQAVVAVMVLATSAARAGDVVPVRYGDLNLANASDTEVLAKRVYAVAELRCAEQRPDQGHQSLFYKMIYDECTYRVSHATTARVMAAVGEPRRYASL
jgi:UrcA family protein